MNSSELAITSFNGQICSLLIQVNKVMVEGLRQEDPKGHYANIMASQFIIKNFTEMKNHYGYFGKLGKSASMDVYNLKLNLERNKGCNTSDILCYCVIAAHEDFGDKRIKDITSEFIRLRKESMLMWRRIKEGEDATIKVIDKIPNVNPIVQSVINDILKQVPKSLKHSFKTQLEKVDNPLQHLKKLIKSNNLDIAL